MYTSSMSTILTNPFVKARKTMQLTQSELAEQVGVSRNFISRAESAEYPAPPRILLEFYAGGDMLAYEALSNLYSSYQEQKRKESYGVLVPEIVWDGLNIPHSNNSSSSSIGTDIGTDMGPVHPLTWWMMVTYMELNSAVSLYEICKSFCVHHSVMHRWLTTPEEVASVPKVFLAALFESGYSESTLIALEGAYKSYRDGLLLERPNRLSYQAESSAESA